MMRHLLSIETTSHQSLIVAPMWKDLDRLCEYLQEPPKKNKKKDAQRCVTKLLHSDVLPVSYFMKLLDNSLKEGYELTHPGIDLMVAVTAIEIDKCSLVIMEPVRFIMAVRALNSRDTSL
eukprot:TRINITY_DN36435_c0_g1_i1.p1 TRINITY_DN36435_c0_g1~~TRINITY_DN36435_c0_g1_i1.p1  ORF type:complete len:120 (-),score=9.68 TRINITY_DN36435_c0_g1_i1:347-706(-)